MSVDHASSNPKPVSSSSALVLLDPNTQPLQSHRDYRKGNWTLQETLILIAAKRLDDERRTTHRSNSSAAARPPRSAELRWKWVENYCWKNGCLRSQNQCNDKWDNLLRDYKKVRDYQSRSSSDATAAGGPGKASASYWAMEKHERKERNLPSNLSAEVFDALTDVLSRRSAHRAAAAAAARAQPLLPSPPQPPPPALASCSYSHSQQQRPPPVKEPTSAPPPLALPLPPPPPATLTSLPPAKQPSLSGPSVEMSESSESDGNGRADSGSEPKKRRKVGSSSSSSSVVQGASVLARTLQACEEKRDKRHRELLDLEERRLRLESDRAELNRQGFAGLIAAVNALSGAIHALVSSSDHRGGHAS